MYVGYAIISREVVASAVVGIELYAARYTQYHVLRLEEGRDASMSSKVPIPRSSRRQNFTKLELFTFQHLGSDPVHD